MKDKFPKWLYNCFDAAPTEFDYQVQDVHSLLNAIIDESLNSLNNSNCIIPISGGWDSRILLCAALERVDSQQIKTFSFGVPGQLDYDLGRYIASKAGVEHASFDLSTVELTWENLLQSVRSSPWTGVPDSFYNHYCIDQIAAKGDIVLSGFLGDPLTGGHDLKGKNNKDLLFKFLKKQKRVTSVQLNSDNYHPSLDILSIPQDDSRISTSELLDLGIRQINYVAGIIAPQNKWKGWDINFGELNGTKIIAPFVHPKWGGYWLQAPFSAKKNQQLYLNMMRSYYPVIANLPSKYSYGVKSNHYAHYLLKKYSIKINNALHSIFPKYISQSNKLNNYLNYEDAFRTRDDYIAVLDQAILYLEEENITPWLNLTKLKQDHLSFKKDYSDGFLVLIGLALNLINEKK